MQIGYLAVKFSLNHHLVTTSNEKQPKTTHGFAFLSLLQAATKANGFVNFNGFYFVDPLIGCPIFSNAKQLTQFQYSICVL